MTLTLDWFLPTSGDGRTIYGRATASRWTGRRHCPFPARAPRWSAATHRWPT